MKLETLEKILLRISLEYDKEAPMVMLKEQLAREGKTEGWWIKSQIKLLEELGYIYVLNQHSFKFSKKENNGHGDTK